MEGLVRLKHVAYVYMVGFFYGFMVALAQVKSLVTIGPTRMLTVKDRQRPAVLDDPALGEHGFVRLNDVRLHYVANGPTDKPLMLFLHGFPEFWYTWRHQLKYFSKSYRAVAVDMRGYGESDKPRGVHNYSLPTLAADIDQLIVALGYEKCVLVSHDWGGVVGWAVAALYPHRVDRLIVMNGPHHTGFFDHIWASKKQFKMSWYMFYFQVPFLPEFAFRADDFAMLGAMAMGAKKGTFTDDDIEASKYAFKDYDAVKCAIDYYRHVMQNVPNVLKKMKSAINVPTLIIWGTEDMALDIGVVDVSKNFVSEDCQVHLIKDGSHWIQQEEPDQVNECMSKYLDQDVPRHAASKL